MFNALKKSLLVVAAAATVLGSMSVAEAGDRRWRDRDDRLAIGALGLAAGAIIGGAIADSRSYNRVYVEPARPRVIYPRAPRHYDPVPTYYPAPVYDPAPTYYPPSPSYARPVATYGGYEPWSPGWYDYCSSRYRSFDPSSGTYRGYDGRDHFCVAD